MAIRNVTLGVSRFAIVSAAVLTVLALVGREAQASSDRAINVLDRVAAYSTDSRTIYFHGDELAAVYFRGFGGHVLHLYIYDEHGNLIRHVTDYAGQVTTTFVPAYYGPFRIVVVNIYGESQAYELVTN